MFKSIGWVCLAKELIGTWLLENTVFLRCCHLTSFWQVTWCQWRSCDKWSLHDYPRKRRVVIWKLVQMTSVVTKLEGKNRSCAIMKKFGVMFTLIKKRVLHLTFGDINEMVNERKTEWATYRRMIEWRITFAMGMMKSEKSIQVHTRRPWLDLVFL